MGRGGRNQVGEAFEGNGVAVVNEAFDRFAQGENLSHGRSRLVALDTVSGDLPYGHKVLIQ